MCRTGYGQTRQSINIRVCLCCELVGICRTLWYAENDGRKKNVLDEYVTPPADSLPVRTRRRVDPLLKAAVVPHNRQAHTLLVSNHQQVQIASPFCRSGVVDGA